MTDTRNKQLKVEGLTISFQREGRSLCAVDNVSFHINAGETVGLVGESGCGKSLTALSILRLVPTPPGIVEADRIQFGDQNLCDLPASEMRRIRGNKISMIFQEPMTSLNPVFSIGNQVAEAFQIHQTCGRKEARRKSIEVLQQVRIPDPEKTLDSFPHQLSGGMRQRVMIAMALACRPDLLIADEPTTALDVTIQAQILHLIGELQRSIGMAMLLITHDLGVVAQVCRRVLVMYAGRIVEEASAEDIFRKPMHPYTTGLLNSLPQLDRRVERLPTIEGSVPDLGSWPEGCRFQDRCPQVMQQCRMEEPPLGEIGTDHKVACWLR
jgi:oligopeptide/dipeptide ABC transporter ATP-binding protein